MFCEQLAGAATPKKKKLIDVRPPVSPTFKLEHDASASDVKKGYFKAARVWHPGEQTLVCTHTHTAPRRWQSANQCAASIT